MKRSHHCNQLRKENAGSKATLIGWIDSLRDHGGVFFLDLRDREGKTQVVLDPDNQTLSELFPKLKPESVIEIRGEVRNRDKGTENSPSVFIPSGTSHMEKEICILKINRNVF